jgi:hypothetical protein
MIEKVENKKLIEELKEKEFLLKNTEFTDGKTSKIFQKQFNTLKEALAYTRINPKTLKRYGVICIVKEKDQGGWDVGGKKA